MENLVDNIIKIDIKDIKSYTFPLDESFGLEVNNKGIKFCFIIKFSSTNKNLICCGPGAHARDEKTSDGTLKKPPFFDRWSWFRYFDESFIAYADPIFFYDDEITLGWFVGDKDQWYAETVSKIIESLAYNQKIKSDNILFYGSSGGGFVSVCLGTLIRGSKVLVNNTQFNIFNYYEYHINNLLRLLKNEFIYLTEEEIINQINFRLNTIELFKKEEYVPKIIYYVNTSSEADLNNHCFPFIKDIKELDFFNDVEIHFYKEDKEYPHIPLSSEESVSIIKSFCKKFLYN